MILFKFFLCSFTYFILFDRPLLLENGEYEESEKRQVIDQTTAYSELITGGFRESVLPTVHLEAQSVPSGFASLGQSLIAGFTRISEDKILVCNDSSS